MLAMLCACGGRDQTAELTPAENDAGAFDDLTGTLDRAGEVEELGRARKAELDDALEEAKD